MKKLCLSISVIGLLVLGSACNNEQSSTPAKPEEQTTPTTTPESHETTTPPSGKDTAKTTINVGPTGAEVHTKEGTGVSASPSGVDVKTKDVNIGVKTK